MREQLVQKDPKRKPLRAQELAWVVEQLGGIGIRCRSAGWCIGDLTPGELRIGESGLIRVNEPGILLQRHQEFRAARHLHSGHDAGCLALGVPRRVVERLVRDWGGVVSATYVLEGIDQAVREVHRRGSCRPWTEDLASEELRAAIRARITPSRPSVTPEYVWRTKAAAPRRVRAAFEMTQWWISTRGLPRIVRLQVGSSSE